MYTGNPSQQAKFEAARHARQVIAAVLADPAVRSATKFIAINLIVRATRRVYKNPKAQDNQVIVTIGAPDYRELRFIRECRRAGVTLPVRKVRLRLIKRRA